MSLRVSQEANGFALDRLTGSLRDALEAVVVHPSERRVNRPTLGEVAAVVVISSVIAAVAFALSDRFPAWLDEAQFIDPAASRLFGDGFSSTAWPFQTRVEYWAGNAPLYSALLADWMRAVGFGTVEARSFNYLLAVIAGVLLWWACCRLGVLRKPTTRLLFVVTFLAGHGVTLDIWSARYDCLAMVLAALCLLNVTISSQTTRTIGFVVLGALLPATGIHLLFYIGLMTAVSVLAFRRDAMPAAGALGAGVALGMAFLYLLFSTNGVWFKFLVATAGAQHSVTGQLAQVVVQGDLRGVQRLVQFPLAFLEDHSFAVIIAVAAIAFSLTPSNASSRLRASARLAIASGVLIPTALFLAGKFPIYYGWMALAPTALFVYAWGEEYCDRTRSGWRNWPLIVTIAAALVGLPTYVAKAMQLPVTDRNTAIDEIGRRELRPDDWVYADYASYLSARRVATVVMIPSYANTFLVPGLPERENVTALFVSPSTLEAAIERVGGDWIVSTTPGNLPADTRDNTPRVYRRRVKGGTSQ